MSRLAILDAAFGEYGVTEINGSEDNPRIVEYFKEAGHSWVKDDETAWCSAFMNFVAKKAGAECSGKLNARSWLSVGTRITGQPKPGDAVVFWRESRKSWKGHIAIFIRETDTHVYVLGGNQGNRVCITPYPKYRVLEYRDITTQNKK